MAINQRYFNYQSSGLNPFQTPWTSCRPITVETFKWVYENWGGNTLGCHWDRTISGSSSYSTHAYGMARDWQWRWVAGSPRPESAYHTKAEMVAFTEWLKNHSKELAITMIIRPGQIWMAGTTSFRSHGNRYANHFHVEFHPDFQADRRSVPEKLGTVNPPTTPTPPPEEVFPGLFPLNNPINNPDGKPWKKTVRPGASYQDAESLLLVKYAQHTLTLKVDGIYGPKTQEAIRAVCSVGNPLQPKFETDGTYLSMGYPQYGSLGYGEKCVWQIIDYLAGVAWDPSDPRAPEPEPTRWQEHGAPGLYTLREGEWPWNVATRLLGDGHSGISALATLIQGANDLSSGGNWIVGKKILVPNSAVLPTAGRLAVVKKGDRDILGLLDMGKQYGKFGVWNGGGPWSDGDIVYMPYE